MVNIRAFRFRKKIFRFDSIWFSETNRFFDSIRFSTSLPYRRIGYYRLLCCQMSTLLRHHESPSQLHKDVGWDYGSMIIVQANAAAESNGWFFNKTNRFELIRPKRIGESIRIANRNALVNIQNSNRLYAVIGQKALIKNNKQLKAATNWDC